MKPISFIALFYCLTCINLPVFSQTHFVNGSIIKKNGDTLKGFIDFRDWTKSPKEIDFKNDSKKNELTKFKPNDIDGFEVNNLVKYKSYIGPISLGRNDNTLVDQLPNYIDTNKRLDTLFLKQMSAGKYVTLYQQEDEIKFRYFIKANNQPITELLNFPYFDNQGKLIPEAIYKGQLISTLSTLNINSSSLSDEIQETNFNDKDLVKMVDKINGNIIRKARGVSKQQFIGLNYTFSTINFSDNPQNISFPELTYGIDFSKNKEIQKRLFRLELSAFYSGFKFYTYFSNTGTYTPNQISNYNVDRYTIRLSTLYLLNLYNKENFKIFIGAGLHLNYSFYGSSYINSTYKLEYDGETFFRYNFGFKSFWFNPPLLAGVKVNNKFTISITYVGHTYNLSDSPNNAVYRYPNSNNSISLGLKYFLESQKK